MLVEFTVCNYLSFKDAVTISMKASSIKEFEERNVVVQGKDRLLKSAVMFGANSSGKSNLIKALGFMKQMVLKSDTKGSSDEIEVKPFLLASGYDHLPSKFEVVMYVEGIRYRYGFELDRTHIHKEWLFSGLLKKEKALFERNGEKIEMSGDFKEAKGLEDRTKHNTLFLTTADVWNVKQASPLHK